MRSRTARGFSPSDRFIGLISTSKRRWWAGVELGEGGLQTSRGRECRHPVSAATGSWLCHCHRRIVYALLKIFSFIRVRTQKLERSASNIFSFFAPKAAIDYRSQWNPLRCQRSVEERERKKRLRVKQRKRERERERGTRGEGACTPECY